MYIIRKLPTIGPRKSPTPDVIGLIAEAVFARSPYSEGSTEFLVNLRAYDTLYLAIKFSAPARNRPKARLAYRLECAKGRKANQNQRRSK